jgi:ABC-type dipeptide/oligopeptide/nickel transport system ATPase component
MYKGKIIEQGDAKQVLTQPQQAYTQKLLAAVPVLRVG